MNDDLARHLARVAFRVARELQEATSLLKSEAQDEEGDTLSLGIADAIQTVMTNLIDKPLVSRPALQSEIEAQMERYGRYL